MKAGELFRETLQWLQNQYTDFCFFAERDIVWTLQMRISHEIKTAGLPYRVFNEYTVSKGVRTDLAILDGDSVEVAAEIKYEPSHSRNSDRGGDIWPSKLDPLVVFWTGEGSVWKDVQRVRDYVERWKVKEAFSVFIDEGGHFKYRDPHPGSEWIDWGNRVWVLCPRSRGPLNNLVQVAYNSPWGLSETLEPHMGFSRCTRGSP